MIENAFWITCMGMGGVFAFLVLLIIGMIILHKIIGKENLSARAKIATAIAVALKQEG